MTYHNVYSRFEAVRKLGKSKKALPGEEPKELCNDRHDKAFIRLLCKIIGIT